MRRPSRTEAEVWLGSLASMQTSVNVVVGGNPVPVPGTVNQTYTITRRPIPTARGRETTLPSNVVIDLTTWGSTLERTRVPAQAFNHYTGGLDVLINPDGSVVPTTIYSSPSSFGLSGAFMHFWLAERSDVVAPNTSTTPQLPIGTVQMGGGTQGSTGTWPLLKGEYRLVTLFSRTGQITSHDNVYFDNPNSPLNATAGYNANIPYLEVEQGISSGGQ